MKKNTVMLHVIGYFLSDGNVHDIKSHLPGLIREEIKNYRTMIWCGCATPILFFGGLIIAVVLNKFRQYEWIDTAAQYVAFTAIFGSFALGLLAVFSLFSQKDCEGCYRTMEAFREFKECFGKWPEKLGRFGVAIRLTAQAKKIGRLSGDSEYSARNKMKRMYNAAKVLFPVNTYKDYFDAAEQSLKRPYAVPDFNKDW